MTFLSDHTIYTFDVGQYDKKSALRTFTGHTNGNKFFVRISLSTDDRYVFNNVKQLDTIITQGCIRKY